MLRNAVSSEHPPRSTAARITICLLSCAALVWTPWLQAANTHIGHATAGHGVALIGIGDSLTHGTMDATNNALNTWHAYLQKVADSLKGVVPLKFSQPYFNQHQDRIQPFRIPTNLGVDGADLFSVEGLEYYKRVGAGTSYLTDAYIADEKSPFRLSDKYDKVLYPINILARQDVTQLDSAGWLLQQMAQQNLMDRAVIVFWLGNNDTSLAALGSGGENPSYLPIPFNKVSAELSPSLRLLLQTGSDEGVLSFAPYTPEAIERNMTTTLDFTNQLGHILTRLTGDMAQVPGGADLFLLTLPYYSSVGYLMDSEDLEFYLRKLDPAFTVPASFARVTEPGQPISDPMRGDRVSLLTFGFMYAMLTSGHTAADVATVLEDDGLVLSEAEQALIVGRIDQYNQAIQDAATAFGSNVHLVDVGGYLNQKLSGSDPVVVDGRTLTRNWSRGGGFSLDGVHPGYTAQALIANQLLTALNDQFGFNASLYDLAAIRATDVYADNDGDGWVPGPSAQGTGITSLLFLFKDPDDSDPNIGADLGLDVWEVISRELLEELLGVSLPVRHTAERLGIETTNVH